MTTKAKTKTKPAAPETLAAAFLEFQRRVKPAELDKMNDHYRRSGGGAYASLSSMKRAAKPALHACGLSYWFKSTHDDACVRVDMTIEHAASGEKRETIGASFPVQRGKGNPAHAVKSVITYAKRATFADALGLDTGPGDDDDGNEGGSGGPVEKQSKPVEPVSFAAQVNERRTACGWTVEQVVELIKAYGVEKADEVPVERRASLLSRIIELSE